MAIKHDKNKERPVVDSVKTGEFLAALRKAAGYTQQEVADYLGITNKTVSKWESGAGLPEISILPAVAEMYDVTVDELLAGKRLERFVEKEATEGHFGGKGEKPEKIEARRRWLEGTAKERFCTAQILLWGTMTVGTVLFVALYLMAGPYRRFPKWVVDIGWLGWMMTEGMAAYIFWMWHRRGIQTLAEERNSTKEQWDYKIQQCRNRLLLPFFVSLALLIPLMLQTEYDGQIVGWERWQVLSETIWAYTRTSGRIVGYICHWIGNLPVSALVASVLWVILEQCGKKISAEEKKQLRKTMIIVACLAVSIFVVSFGVKKIGLPNYVTFTSQESFDRYVNEYFFQYNSYRLYGSHDGPEMVYGVERIDPDYYDYTAGRSIDNEEYEGLVFIDYENLKVWRIGTVVERELVNAWVGVIASGLYLSLMIWFWIVYYRKIGWKKVV
ncbi:MAG: helix-turn-helix transcriptional regulator [Lachnospiraceae bacterium]|nr:helix-turn-helix transcriptional regulator [Lachnospiraceae bacterium]